MRWRGRQGRQGRQVPSKDAFWSRGENTDSVWILDAHRKKSRCKAYKSDHPAKRHEEVVPAREVGSATDARAVERVAEVREHFLTGYGEDLPRHHGDGRLWRVVVGCGRRWKAAEGVEGPWKRTPAGLPGWRCTEIVTVLPIISSEIASSFR